MTRLLILYKDDLAESSDVVKATTRSPSLSFSSLPRFPRRETVFTEDLQADYSRVFVRLSLGKKSREVLRRSSFLAQGCFLPPGGLISAVFFFSG